MKKTIWFAAAAMLMLGLCACGSGAKSAVNVVSREDGSGTRGAFVELMGVTDADGNDATAESAEITNSTAVMLATVAGNKNAVGYVSLGSLSADVKAVRIDGVEPTVENILGGSYAIARPFNICYQDGSLSQLAADFESFILSADGQAVIAENGYIAVADGAAYTAAGLSGKLTLAGSTSVAPVMEKLADAYKALNPGVSVEVQQSGSSAGISSAIEGVCDFGMSSRELKDSEAAQLKTVTIARDGIAVIVNLENTVSSLTAEQVKSIFLGNVADWSELG